MYQQTPEDDEANIDTRKRRKYKNARKYWYKKEEKNVLWSKFEDSLRRLNWSNLPVLKLINPIVRITVDTNYFFVRLKAKSLQFAIECLHLCLGEPVLRHLQCSVHNKNVSYND